MLTHLKNIDTSFRHIRLFSYVLIVANALTCCYVVYSCQQSIRLMQSKVLVIANSKLFQATAASREAFLPIEIKDHVETFHFNFYTLAPDELVIKKNVTKALYLADISAKEEYDNLKESGYYSSIVSANISQTIEPDSVSINLDTTPYQFTYFGKIKIVRSSSILIRSLITTGTIRITTPSDNNVHGMLIEKWRIIDNKDLSIQKR
ncbi:conjugative transposon TraK protein [Chitinophaga niastensis]|uniref:Conjugative transposon TraK protein n=1 Tax=Chitinophaga niastensis TaxID=536980 RepID=A0A2P8H9C0_CHINA|nr:conjugative transposon protein TraK [Chitinophaga niastensis]PSL42818.1 conjugative transposon TraK protein [Chitinophaga niastensis]